MNDDISAHSWKIIRGRLPCSTLTVCPKQMPLLLKLDGIYCTTKLFLKFIKTDNIVQIERLRYTKIGRDIRLLHDLINIYPGKSKNLKSQGSLCIFLFLCFLFRSSPPKSFPKVAALKFRKKHPRWISVLVTEHRPSYLTYAMCCPWNLEANISRIFDWLLYLKAPTGSNL